MEKDLTNIFNSLDNLLANADLSDINAESGSGFVELPEGYYLCEVEKADIVESKASHLPMIAMQLKVVEDGLSVDEKTGADKKLTKTANRKIFKYYVIKDDNGLKRFVADMLKFEGDTVGEPLLPKEAFLTSATLSDALDVLIGSCIYYHISKSVNKDGTESTWQNPISWTRAKALSLPL